MPALTSEAALWTCSLLFGARWGWAPPSCWLSIWSVFQWDAHAQPLFKCHSRYAGPYHYPLAGKGVRLWPWAAPGSQSSCFYSHKWVFHIFFFPTLFSSLQWKDTRTHSVNKQEKVSHCWVIADVSNPHWETFNFQLCLAFLLSNHFCDKWSFHSWEAVERFCARLLPQ